MIRFEEIVKSIFVSAGLAIAIGIFPYLNS